MYYKNFLKHRVCLLERRAADNTLWIKVSDNHSRNRDIYFCSLYNRLPIEKFATERASFYNNLESDLTKHANMGDIYLCGDFNVRLKSVGDKNPNTVATAEFEGSSLSTLTNLNAIHTFGIPTYRNLTQRTGIGESIIDLALTNTPENVTNFEIHSHHQD